MCRHTVIATNRNDGERAVGLNRPDVFDLSESEGERPKKVAEP